MLEERFDRMIKPFGISMTQYNVLRILRGAGPAGAPAERSASASSPVSPTSPACWSAWKKPASSRVPGIPLTAEWSSPASPPRGLKLLSELDKPMRELDGLLKPIGEKKIEKMLKLLDELRTLVREG